MAERGEHPPYLPVSTFMNGHVDNRPVTPQRRHAHRGGRRADVVELDTLLQSPNVSVGEPARDRDAIGLFDAVARMEQRVSQIAIVGQEEHSGGRIIEAPHRDDPRTPGNQFGDGCASLRIAHCGNDARRLIEQQIRALSGNPNGLAVDLHAVALANQRPELRNDAPVDANRPICDELVGASSRSDARLREKPIEANSGADGFSPLHRY